MPTLEEEYRQYQGAQGVNDMYDAQKQAKLAGLESAYQQSLSDAQAAKDQIPGQYQKRANDLAVQYERQRRNLDQRAAATGLNTGAGSQMQLALGGNWQRDYGAVRTAQQQALDAADKGIRDLETAYRTSVQQAVADNDYQRAQALLAEYKERYQQQLQQAQTLAGYGDFSGYAGVPGYSQEQVDSMRSAWVAANPDLAYQTGAITAEQYQQITGKTATGTGGAAYLPYTPPPEETGDGPLDKPINDGKTSSGDKEPLPTNPGADADAAFNDAMSRLNGATSADEATQYYNMVMGSAMYAYFSDAQKQQLQQLYAQIFGKYFTQYVEDGTERP